MFLSPSLLACMIIYLNYFFFKHSSSPAVASFTTLALMFQAISLSFSDSHFVFVNFIFPASLSVSLFIFECKLGKQDFLVFLDIVASPMLDANCGCLKRERMLKKITHSILIREILGIVCFIML